MINVWRGLSVYRENGPLIERLVHAHMDRKDRIHSSRG